MSNNQLETLEGYIAIVEDEVSKLKVDLRNLHQEALGDNPMTSDEALSHFQEVQFIHSEILRYNELLKNVRPLVEIQNDE